MVGCRSVLHRAKQRWYRLQLLTEYAMAFPLSIVGGPVSLAAAFNNDGAISAVSSAPAAGVTADTGVPRVGVPHVVAITPAITAIAGNVGLPLRGGEPRREDERGRRTCLSELRSGWNAHHACAKRPPIAPGYSPSRDSADFGATACDSLAASTRDSLADLGGGVRCTVMGGALDT